jgi:simple sugar transport system ATP-binding protein
MTTPPAVSFERITKHFGALAANAEITFTVAPGEIHAVVGENGAGKSTLMKILYGHLRADSGRVLLDGRPVAFNHPRQAIRAGIGMVHQHMLVFPNLTAWENVIAGEEPSRAGQLEVKRARGRVEDLCRRYGMDLDPDAAAEDLPYGLRQHIELLRVLHRGSNVLILDEPTSLLAPPEVERFLCLLKRLKAAGHTILLVSHRLGEVMAVSDRITILRRGRRVGTYASSVTHRDEIARSIVFGVESGDDSFRPTASASTDSSRSKTFRPVKPALEVDRLSTVAMGREAGLEEVSLKLWPGEILGIGGVVGNGQRTLAAALLGFLPEESGRCLMNGVEITGLGVRERMERGFTWLPGNPAEEALLPRWSIWENMALGRQRRRHFQTVGILQKREIRRWAKNELAVHAVAHPSLDEPVETLSGGNRQKLALAKVLAGRPKLAILEQPGRGLDIRALDRLRRHVRVLRAYGTSFVLISYDLEELLALCDRIGVLYRGRLMGIMDRESVDCHRLARWMVGESGGV